ncbi:hypothetical protein XM38_040410 [Halomicronema hongdechloris C2206]|uniref:Glycosyltransferase RgtA/B/C/D-like domain-containing protein n=1 Tax=Halomicronema hongdechloris C2206 TaxID=1641165 RepID=A0A1Z3HS00_9CYAN|nr:glycosyltransferase family 39 protein [Halomicronema hongdechloris]ASC73079.1 hypothetical protein XM38_040410 [Halomicronema hongdechloris C2206]
MGALPSSLGRWGGLCLTAMLGLRLLFWGLAFPNPDEAYYWLWGQHLDWSYYDHPPWQAWSQALSTALWGRSTWALRWPNLISNGLLLLGYWRINRYLYGYRGRERFWLTLMLLGASPLFFLFLALAWPDHWLVTFSVWAGYLWVRFLDGYLADGRGATWRLYGAAFSVGAAGLCKYTAVLVPLAGLALVVRERQCWPLLRDRRLYGAGAIALLCLSPILIWNLQHDFFSFRYYLDRSTTSTGFAIQPLQPLGFWLLSGLILSPLLAWRLWRTWRQPPPTTASLYGRFAGWLFGLSTGGFSLLALVAPVLYYWNILAYPLWLPLLAGAWLVRQDHVLPAKRASWPRSLLVTQLLGLAAATLLVIHYTVMPLTAWLGTADNDSAALYGWQSLARAVQAQAAQLSDGDQPPLWLTTDYRSAAALAYALNDPSVMALSGRLDQFDFWYDRDALQGRNAVLLGETWHPICPSHQAFFQQTSRPDSLTVERWGQPIQTYGLLRGTGFQAGPSDEYPLLATYPLAFSSDGEVCRSAPVAP